MNPQIKKIVTWIGATVIFLAILVGVVKLISGSDSGTTASSKMTPVTKDDIQTGPASASATLVEYADFQCPACASYNPIVDQLKTSYKGKVNFVYRFFPLTQIHPNAQISAQAGWAALQQNKFFEMKDLLFQNQNQWAEVSDPKQTFIDYAKQLGMDTTKFTKDMTSSEAEKAVANDVNKANNDGINSTPTFYLNGNLINNPPSLDEFKKIIDSQISK